MNHLFVLIACGIFALHSSAGIAQTTTSPKWTLDRTHSTISFAVSHMVVAEAEGKFDSFDLAIAAEKDDFSDAKIDLTIQVASINTNNQDRDKHLRGTDFFDAEKYPTITFKSKEFKKISDTKYKLIGDFTMHGITKTLELDTKFGGVIKDNRGRYHAGFKVTGEINRQDYGVTWSRKLDAGGAVVGDIVEFKGTIELLK